MRISFPIEIGDTIIPHTNLIFKELHVSGFMLNGQTARLDTDTRRYVRQSISSTGRSGMLALFGIPIFQYWFSRSVACARVEATVLVVIAGTETCFYLILHRLGLSFLQ